MVRLKSIKYKEFENTVQKWELDDLILGEINLLVGKNASGKSRVINIINSLAKLFSGTRKLPLSGDYDIEYLLEDKVIRYQLKYEEEQVIWEKFTLDGKILLNRGSGGEGTIWAEEIDGGKEIRFQSPTSEVAVVTRQDNIQHKFLESLYSWGSSLRHYQFGSSLGKDHLAILRDKIIKKTDEKDSNEVIILFNQAINEFGEAFKQAVINDMNKVGYALEDIGICTPVSVHFTNTLGEIVGLYVREKELPGITDQASMSQGMFRALSLLIQINYSQIIGKPSCILIDDIGEGLDFDRACRLIDLLREKAKTSNTQLVLATNDRFVMNRVPLEEWSVLQRQGNCVHILNNINSGPLFEEFKETGLSNFTFLEMDFASGPTPEE